MTLDLGDSLPPSLVASCAAMTVGRGADCVPACRLGEPGRFDRALCAFGAAHHEPDRGALVSLWSMYYLASLIAPTTAALLCRDRILPVGFEDLGLGIADTGLASFRLSNPGCAAACGNRRFETMVEGHLAPFVSLCSARACLSPRVVWSNAAVVLDWVLGELQHVDTIPAVRAEAEALLAGHAGACRLAHPLRTNLDGTRTRRVCCLRYRLPGVSDCGGLCPRDRSIIGRSRGAD